MPGATAMGTAQRSVSQMPKCVESMQTNCEGFEHFTAPSVQAPGEAVSGEGAGAWEGCGAAEGVVACEVGAGAGADC